MFVVVGTVDFRAQVTVPHGLYFTGCVNRERLAFSEGDFDAAQKIMQLLAIESLCWAELRYGNRFETTPDMGMTG